jgi:hypothetical protein
LASGDGTNAGSIDGVGTWEQREMRKEGTAGSMHLKRETRGYALNFLLGQNVR